jgi:hypothetical protein
MRTEATGINFAASVVLQVNKDEEALPLLIQALEDAGEGVVQRMLGERYPSFELKDCTLRKPNKLN